jgi:hypothetical protein
VRYASDDFPTPAVNTLSVVDVLFLRRFPHVAHNTRGLMELRCATAEIEDG